MPEIKHGFSKGKMNKDLDERLVPNGEYRDAMNIQVSTSEGSDVGTAQNILGNKEVGANADGLFEFVDYYGTVIQLNLLATSKVVGTIADEKNDLLYWFVWTTTANYIFSHKRNDVLQIVFIDTNNVLKFSANNIITGINIIDGMIFWTDNTSEPKKINIERCFKGTKFPDHTRLINNNSGINWATGVDMEEKHVTVIKKTPATPPEMILTTSRDPEKIYTGVITVGNDDGGVNDTSFNTNNQPSMYNFNGITTVTGSNTFWVKVEEGVSPSGDIISINNIPPDFGFLYGQSTATPGLTGWQTTGQTGPNSIPDGTKVVLKPFDDDGTPPGLPLTDFVIKGIVEDWDVQTLKIRVTSIDGFAPTPDATAGQTELKYVIDLFDESEKLFEFKFPRFSYRYKYEDGEYSPFAPFTQVAFSPGSFDYHPRKGYNIGMTNRLTKVELGGMIKDDMPKDVTSVDILFKDELSSSIYIVDTIKPDDDVPKTVPATNQNTWDIIMNGGYYVMEKETVNSVVPSNQMLRPWDNVPRKALAQDITANRIVYANYVQNYNLVTEGNRNYLADLKSEWDEFEVPLTEVGKSIKTLREYQLGVVFIDKYGRETPIISNSAATMKLEKTQADKYNRIKTGLKGSNPPIDLTHFKFFVKETSNEYYNLAMDRWYPAEDGNIWLAFPSSDRNKVDIDTFLILKKGADKDELVAEAARYKIIALESEAPDFIKTKKSIFSKETHYYASASLNTPGNPVFDAGVEDKPMLGATEFKLNYGPYNGTPGRDLHNYNKGFLYIQFGMVGEDELSQRYLITNLTCTYEPVDSGTLSNATYNIQIDKSLGNDVNFITDDPSGISPSGIKDGAIVYIYKYEVDNLPQFDGRFFAKIYYDEVFKKNISKTYLPGLNMRITQSKKVYAMRPGMIEQFTLDMQDWFLQSPGNGNGTGHRFPFINSPSTQGPPGTGAPTHDVGPIRRIASKQANTYQLTPGTGVYQWGQTLAGGYRWPGVGWGAASSGGQGLWTNDPDFDGGDTYIAARGVYRIGSTIAGTGGTANNMYSWGGFGNRNHYGYYENDKFCGNELYFKRFLPFLGPHRYQLDPAADNPLWNSNAYSDTDETFRVAMWTGGGDKSDPANWSALYKNMREGTVSGFQWNYNTDKFHYRSEYGDSLNNETTKDAEVWFIDDGRVAGWRSTDNSCWLNNHDDTQGGISENRSWMGVPASGNISGQSEGITKYSTQWKMELAFGGIDGEFTGVGQDACNQESTHLYSVGGWNTTSINPNYNSSTYTDFVMKMNPGEQFRWREDPTQTIYTYGTNIKEKRRLRYSTRVGHEYNNSDSVKLSHSGEVNAMTMAAHLSSNHTKGWKGVITPALQWEPYESGGSLGEIPNNKGLKISLTLCRANNTAGSMTFGNPLGPDGNTVSIFVTDIKGNDSHGYGEKSIHVGMGLKSFTRNIQTSLTFPAVTSGTSYVGLETPIKDISSTNEYYVVTKIIPLPLASNPQYFQLELGGYNGPMLNDDHKTWLIGSNAGNISHCPADEGSATFVQLLMNGQNENTEFNINTNAYYLESYMRYNNSESGNSNENSRVGKVGAVGYNLDFIEKIEPEEVMSENPAIWETEPKDAKDLNIYYEATGAIPMVVDSSNIYDAVPVGSTFELPGGAAIYTVTGYDGAKLELDMTWVGPSGVFRVKRPDELEIGVRIIGFNQNILTIDPFFYNSNLFLPWHNCYSFGNGVESNRIRDNYNLPYILNGVKASTSLEQEYKEEHRKYGLIYSGIYNSTSGVNNLNQFIQAEKITKDVNPIYGSIQKLHTRDGDLVTLCEDKCLRILASKDALFNADGKTQLTATESTLGQTIPFSGEYGISTNPESFASESYRVYFADKVRGVILRLSKDGLTPISTYGMKDWFRDNLKLTNKIIGSYDDRQREYNIKLDNDIDFYVEANIGGLATFVTPGSSQVSETTPTGNIYINEATWNDLPYSSKAQVGTDITFQHPITGADLLPAGTTITSLELVNLTWAAGYGAFFWRIQVSNPIIDSITGVPPSELPFSNSPTGGGGIAGGSFMNFGGPIVLRIIYGEITDSPVLSFREDVKGWVSFRSFIDMQMGVSMGNDYYTFKEGNLYKHYSEEVPRNVFYGDFDNSSITVLLNDNPSFIKTFSTLNYEGSQSKRDKFDEQVLNLPYQPSTSYNDQEYYNLYAARGWDVKSVTTDKEIGYVNEFLEKEGKWFNNINKEVLLRRRVADTADFTFQGIGFADNTSVAGCTNRNSANYNPLATIDDGTCEAPIGCTNPYAENFDGLTADGWVENGTCRWADSGFQLQIRDASSPVANDGAARVVYTGTQVAATYPGFTYAWSNGDTTESISNLGMGPIGLTLTDNNGMVHIVSNVYPGPIAFVEANIVSGCTNPSAANYDWIYNSDCAGNIIDSLDYINEGVYGDESCCI